MAIIKKPIKKPIKKAQVGDTIKKTWQQMNLVERTDKKNQLFKEGGPKRYMQYKDSVRADTEKRIDEQFAKNAAIRGMTVDELKKFNSKNSKKPDVPSCDTSDPNFKSGSCGTSKAAAKEAKLNWKSKKNGGTVTKAKDGKWMQKAAASIKKRGTAGKCTPITKPGCTGKAKALAKTFKKIAKSNKKK